MIRSALESSFIITFFSGLSKVMGYGRIILIASLFGASAGMDSFYVAMGALGLLANTAQSVLESAGLPLLIQAEKIGKDRDFMASLVWIVGGCTVVFLFAMMFSARGYVRLFGMNFDLHRLDVAENMVLLLLPWVGTSIFQGLLTIWANFRGRYSLPSISSCLFNVLAVPLIWWLGGTYREYAVAISFSVSSLVFLSILWWFLRDLPLSFTEVPWKMIGGTFKNVSFCLVIVGAGGLYQATDRFFASALPAGNISAMSYAEMIFGLPLTFVAPSLLIYLAKSSRVHSEGRDGEAYLRATLAIGWTYFLPIGLALASVSTQVINFALNYGRFGEEAVAITSSCLAILALAMPMALWQGILVRYAQSVGRLSVLVLWSLISVSVNIGFDWFLSKKLGLVGICLATTFVWIGSSLFYVIKLSPGLLKKMALPMLYQGAIGLIWCLAVRFLGMGDLVSLFIVAFAVVFHLLLCQFMGLLKDVPQNWRPVDVVAFLFRRFCLNA